MHMAPPGRRQGHVFFFLLLLFSYKALHNPDVGGSEQQQEFHCGLVDACAIPKKHLLNNGVSSRRSRFRGGLVDTYHPIPTVSKQPANFCCRAYFTKLELKYGLPTTRALDDDGKKK